MGRRLPTEDRSRGMMRQLPDVAISSGMLSQCGVFETFLEATPTHLAFSGHILLLVDATRPVGPRGYYCNMLEIW